MRSNLFETMEPRQMLTGVTLTPDQTLHIDGSAGGDRIVVENARGKLNVLLITPKKTYAYRLKPTLVKRLVIGSGRGNDIINVTASTLRSAVIATAAGDDAVYAHGNALLIDGGDGNDRITTINNTGAGTNNLVGGNGSDRLNARGGMNHLDGGTGNDILYHAGNTPVFDTPLSKESPASLARSMVEANRSYDSRANLVGGSGNDLFYAASDDKIIGGKGRDHMLLQADIPGLRRPVHRLDAQADVFSRVDAHGVEIAQISLY